MPPREDDESATLQAAMNGVEKAMNASDLTALQAALEVSGTAVLRAALQISRDARESLSEVLVTQDGLTGRPADVLATLLPWRRGRIQTLGMP
jgi:hypothetical protein